MVLMCLLLLNMLIAMMAKTFDHVWESSETNFQFLFTQMVFSAKAQPTAPPPLYLLIIYGGVLEFAPWAGFSGESSTSSKEFVEFYYKAPGRRRQFRRRAGPFSSAVPTEG